MTENINTILEKYLIPVEEDALLLNADVCRECNGHCCRYMGCHLSPTDFKEITVQSIINLIDESKCISIDWWEGNPVTGESDNSKAYYLRISNVNSSIIDPSFGGQCSILTDSGCPLSFCYRPKGGRELIPTSNDNLNCKSKYTKKDCAAEWLPYKDILKEVTEYYIEKGDIVDPLTMLMNMLSDM